MSAPWDADVDAILNDAPDVVDDVRPMLVEAWQAGYTAGFADQLEAENVLARAKRAQP